MVEATGLKKDSGFVCGRRMVCGRPLLLVGGLCQCALLNVVWGMYDEQGSLRENNAAYCDGRQERGLSGGFAGEQSLQPAWGHARVAYNLNTDRSARCATKGQECSMQSRWFR